MAHIDYYPDIIRVTLTPEPCSKEECGGDGATITGFVRFNFLPFARNGHRLRVGLKGGQLKLNLHEAPALTILPIPTFAAEAQMVETREATVGAEIKVKEPAITAKQTQTTAVTNPLLQISAGGIGSSRPWWLFRKDSREFIIGDSPILATAMAKQEHRSCRVDYVFEAELADWDYAVTVSKNAPLVKRPFAWCSMNLAGKSIIRKLIYRSTLSRGNWRCRVAEKVGTDEPTSRTEERSKRS